MARQTTDWRLPVQRDAERLQLLLEQMVRQFPRYHKYTLGSELRSQAMSILRLINRALHDKKHQYEYVRRLVFAVDDIKLQIRLAKELEAFAHFSDFEETSTLAVSIGKQAGGWLKRLTPEQP